MIVERRIGAMLEPHDVSEACLVDSIVLLLADEAIRNSVVQAAAEESAAMPSPATTVAILERLVDGSVSVAPAVRCVRVDDRGEPSVMRRA